MTGGGPSGATKLYAILAYEKAIGALQYGPGIAIAFSVAPLMALLIWLLARFMRQDDKRDGSSTKTPGIVDRMMAAGGRLVSLVVDVLFWPVQVAYAGLDWVIQRLRLATGRRAEEPILTSSASSQGGVVARLALLSPFLVFVLFPFFWIIITSLKIDQSDQRSGARSSGRNRQRWSNTMCSSTARGS